MNNVEELVEYYCTTDEPVPYKGLSIYPVKVKKYRDFLALYSILTIDKNQIPDIEIIQMSYLDFLLDVEFNDETILDEQRGLTKGIFQEQRFSALLQLCFQVEAKELKVKRMEGKHSVLLIGEVEIDSKSFDEIIKIISFQNIYDYYDGYIDPEFKKTVDEYYAVKNKDLKAPSLEQKIAVVSSFTGFSKNQILEMTYREFETIFQLNMAKENYEIMRLAEIQGVKFDKPVKHWLYAPRHSKYEEAFTSYDGFKDKVSQT